MISFFLQSRCQSLIPGRSCRHPLATLVGIPSEAISFSSLLPLDCSPDGSLFSPGKETICAPFPLTQYFGEPPSLGFFFDPHNRILPLCVPFFKMQISTSDHYVSPPNTFLLTAIPPPTPHTNTKLAIFFPPNNSRSFVTHKFSLFLPPFSFSPPCLFPDPLTP